MKKEKITTGKVHKTSRFYSPLLWRGVGGEVPTGIVMLTGLLLLALFLSSSCTKKVDRWSDQEADPVYDTVKTLPGNRIIEYKVANIIDDPIYSAVDDSLKTITVYLPAYYQLGIIQPEIKLPEGATISPTADEPVPVFSETPFTYQVTSAKGEKANYTVTVVVQQQDFILNELSSAATTTTVKATTAQYGAPVNLKGLYFVDNYSVTRAYLYDVSGKMVTELTPTGNQAGLADDNSLWYYIGYPTNVETGDYYIEVRSYALTKRMQYPIHFIKYGE